MYEQTQNGNDSKLALSFHIGNLLSTPLKLYNTIAGFLPTK